MKKDLTKNYHKKTRRRIAVLFLILAVAAGALFLVIKRMGFDPWNFLVAAIIPWSKPGPFTLELASRCLGGQAQVLLFWTKSDHATTYLIERKALDQRQWERIERLRQPTQNMAIDQTFKKTATWYLYRIKAISGPFKTFSDIQGIALPDCRQTTVAPTASLDLTASPSPTTVISSEPTIIPTPAATIQEYRWGAYAGWQLADIQEFEKKAGQAMNLYALFIHWGNENEFPSALATQITNPNKTLLIFWEAMDYTVASPEQPNFSYDNILRGDWNQYIQSFAQQAKVYGQPVIMVPFEEMNGDWYPWSGTINSNTPQKHISAYRHIHDLFRDVANVKFGWAINHDSVPDIASNQPEMYYPGDEYVDYVGVNGFNFGEPWQTFGEIFNDALQQLKNYQKPIYIFSFACAPGPLKAAWISDALSIQILQHPEIKGWSWFNENKEKDWRIWSDENSLQAFQAALPH